MTGGPFHERFFIGGYEVLFLAPSDAVHLAHPFGAMRQEGRWIFRRKYFGLGCFVWDFKLVRFARAPGAGGSESPELSESPLSSPEEPPPLLRPWLTHAILTPLPLLPPRNATRDRRQERQELRRA
jgi:hypothetical protein